MIELAQLGVAVIRIEPTRRERISWIFRSTERKKRNSGSISLRRAMASLVGISRPAFLSNSSSPSVSSIRFIILLMAGFDTPSSCAAALVVPVSMTARNTSS
jgi:hypothetical protein